jgi:hypothetical protein
MKKTVRKIAFVLLVIMLACVITGCEILQVVGEIGKIASSVDYAVTEKKTSKSLYNKARQNDEADTF